MATTLLIAAVACLVFALAAACDHLRRRNAELSAVIAARDAELTEARAAAEEHGAFAFTAAHDLQSPLRKASAFATLLRARMEGRMDEGDQDLMDRTIRSIAGMQDLVDSLLKLAGVAKGEPPKTVDLSAVAAEVAQELDPAFAVTGGHVRVTRLPIVQADPGQMRLLLENLIGNALKFRRPGRPPEVRVRGQVLADGRCEFVVEDDGVGFDMARAGRLFQPFERLHARADFPGNGLGLALCRTIVARHGGTITADSVIDRGTTFRVRLPRGGASWNA